VLLINSLLAEYSACVRHYRAVIEMNSGTGYRNTLNSVQAARHHCEAARKKLQEYRGAQPARFGR
jgi:hypothetical protein